MTTVIPANKIDQLSFCESHWPTWLAEATGIGVATGAVNDFKQKTIDARAAWDSTEVARQAYRSAVLDRNAILADAVNSASDLVKVIKGFASSQPMPDTVYALAAIPAPAPPSPVPAPGQPTNVTITLQPSGSLTLRWKAVNASASSGTFFTVRRRINGESGFVQIGTVGIKSFTDSTIMLGTTGAMYLLQAGRGDLFGPESELIGVQFGVGGGGGLSVTNATLMPSGAMKMAA